MTPTIPASSYTRLHLRFGWWSLFLFGAFGLLLETFHGFKLGAYLDLANDTRRLMWTLAHAHGVGLALVHVLFAITVQLGLAGSTNHRFISRCLIAASVLLPGGFFAGGVVYYGGDPGLGILVVPLGAVFLLTAVFLLGRATNEMDRSVRSPDRTRKM